ncbi:MBOAT family protein, partial [Aliarcobacter skirrowii]|nr:MBOAT family protein [Aliarcobacter skirrowii]
ILAWFITFNFVNIAWIFFRAKEWDDAIKVLSSMFSLDNVVLPNPLATKLAFLKDFGVEFGGFIANLDNDGGKTLIPMMFFAFILVLFFKNSMEKRESFRSNYLNIIFAIICFSYAILSLNNISEFLYFNF